MKRLVSCAAFIALAACSQPGSDADNSSVKDRSGELIPTPADNDLASGQGSEAPYPGPIPKPISVGGNGPSMDACGTYAEVSNLDIDGHSYLSVRDAPSIATKERARLKAGRGVQVCETENGWSGIIYRDEGDDATDCGTGTPVATEQNYTGPCRQGWVDSRYLEMIAG